MSKDGVMVKNLAQWAVVREREREIERVMRTRAMEDAGLIFVAPRATLSIC